MMAGFVMLHAKMVIWNILQTKHVRGWLNVDELVIAYDIIMYKADDQVVNIPQTKK